MVDNYGIGKTYAFNMITLEDLIGKQIIAVVNFKPIHISEVTSEVLVLGVVLLNLDSKVENGLKIS